MRRVTYESRSLLVGDEAADALVDFAATIADVDRADRVTLAALQEDGEPVEVTFLFDSGATLLTETAKVDLAEPDNSAAIAYLRTRTPEIALSRPHLRPERAGTVDVAGLEVADF